MIYAAWSWWHHIMFHSSLRFSFCRNFPQGTISDMIKDASQGISFICNNIVDYGGDPNRYGFYVMILIMLVRVANCKPSKIFTLTAWWSLAWSLFFKIDRKFYVNLVSCVPLYQTSTWGYQTRILAPSNKKEEWKEVIILVIYYIQIWTIN